MTHDAIISTVGEQMCKLIEHGKTKTEFTITVVHDASDDWSVAYVYSTEGLVEREGKIIGYGSNVIEALNEIVSDLVIPVKGGG